jgi:hypothetical protein
LPISIANNVSDTESAAHTNQDRLTPDSGHENPMSAFLAIASSIVG